jgi:uncharacterized repeat protein (TIGR01451 family)
MPITPTTPAQSRALRRARGAVHPARSRAVAATTAIAIAVLGSVVTMPQAAMAAPATDPATTTYAAGAAFSSVVPNGACAVVATVAGGAGGRAAAGANGVGSNGAGARITATFDVVAGQDFEGIVGGGGATNAGRAGGPGGVNGGGDGGTAVTQHGGAGGGGRSEFTLDGDLLVLAGGGGGSGGGHSISDDGFGGDAGIPSAAGVAAGDAGTAGTDADLSYIVGGGLGGASLPGTGGVHSVDITLNGLDGSGRTGGAGAPDPNYDAGGGGGAGYAGGGGGASTFFKNEDNGVTIVAGGGGGGGSSFVAAEARDLSATAVGRLIGTGAGAGGLVQLDWVPCGYDLAVVKTVDDAAPLIGDTIEWTVEVTNNGADFMTKGDTVTISDSLPGAGAKTITGIAVVGGTNTVLERGAVTCDAVVGDAMPATLECVRPFQPLGGAIDGVRGLDVGETLAITYEQEITDAFGTVLTNTVTVTDRTVPGNNSSTVTSTVTANPPVASNDSDLLNTIGESVTVSVLGNDTAGTGTLVPGSVSLFDASGDLVMGPYTVLGQGVWTVNASTGAVTFAPEAGFEGDPTPVTYVVADTNGLTDTATVTITYRPTAVDDEDLDNVIGSTVDVPVLGNDAGDFDASTLVIMDGATPVTSLVVLGEGTWSVETGGVIRFVPELGFVSDPTPIGYRVDDTKGEAVTADVIVDYLQAAADDSDLGNAIGEVVGVPVLQNDSGEFDTTTLRLLDAGGYPVSSLIVPNEGVWTVQAGGIIRFAPEAGFMGDPTPVDYEVSDVAGDTVSATVTITYVPTASGDADLDNPIGSTVVIDVLANDAGDFDRTSVRLLDGGMPVTSLTVPGEGVWTVDTVSGIVSFVPESGFVGNPTPVDYQVTDVTGDVVDAGITVTYLPVAENDSSLRNTPGTPVTVDVIGNDSGIFDPTSVMLLDPNGDRVRSLRVAGQGTWTVNTSTGAITFTPQKGYFGNPTPVAYEVTDTLRGVVEATVTITYLPTASNDASTGNTPGTPVTLDVVGNDSGDLIPGSVVLIDADGNRVTTLRVPGEGTWTVNPVTGAITFTPQTGFMGNPTPVRYEVTDIYGETTEALAVVTYTVPGMPVTGAEAMPVLLGGGGALLLGALLLAISRRRGTTSSGRHTA